MFRFAIAALAALLPSSMLGQHAYGQAPSSYDFTSPDAHFELSKKLKEISGITVLDDTLLGAVQDERGRVFFLNYHTGKIEKEEKFGKNGDYEDIVRVGHALYVLESNGDLHEIKDWTEKKFDAKRHKTDLATKYDTEGLAYDPANQRLLIACKEYPGKGLKDAKAIYAFDLVEEELINDPVMVIPLDDFEEFYAEQKATLEPSSGLRALLGRTLNLEDFKPSALALHPITNRWYVLSSVRKAIVVLNYDGIMTDVFSLSRDMFAQPEGMAFLANGDLFITNEGRSGKATLLRFNYRIQ